MATFLLLVNNTTFITNKSLVLSTADMLGDVIILISITITTWLLLSFFAIAKSSYSLQLRFIPKQI